LDLQEILLGDLPKESWDLKVAVAMIDQDYPFQGYVGSVAGTQLGSLTEEKAFLPGFRVPFLVVLHDLDLFRVLFLYLHLCLLVHLQETKAVHLASWPWQLQVAFVSLAVP